MYISENNRLCLLHCFPCQVLLSAYWAHVPCPYQHSHSLELCSKCPLFTIRFPRATVPASVEKLDLRLANPCPATQLVTVVVSVFPSLLYLRCVIFWGKEPSSRYLISCLWNSWGGAPRLTRMLLLAP